MVGELALMSPIPHRHFEALSSLVITSIALSCIDDHQEMPARLDSWLDLYTPEKVHILLREPRSCALATISGPAFTAVSLLSGTGELRLCHVAPEWQDQGIGRHLLQAQEEQARRRQIPSIYVDAPPGARRFFERLGFLPTGMEYASAFSGTLARLRKSLQQRDQTVGSQVDELDFTPYLQEHAELTAMIQKLRGGALRTNLSDLHHASGALAALSQFSRRLMLHLLEEDRSVYPKLKTRRSPVQARAEKLEREMGGLREQCKAFEARWASPQQVAADASAFVAETGAMFDAVERRIYREDLELFRAAEPVERRATPRPPIAGGLSATGLSATGLSAAGIRAGSGWNPSAPRRPYS